MLSPYVAAGLPIKDTTTYLLPLVAEHHGVPVPDMISRSRKDKFVRARMTYCVLANVCERKPLKEIGRELGGRDHSSVIHLRDVLLNECTIYEDVRNNLINFAQTISYKWGGMIEKKIAEMK